MTSGPKPTGGVWEGIYREKRQDHLLKRVSIVAWSATLVLVTVLVVIGAISAAQMARAALEGAVPWASVLGTVLPLIVVLGVLTVLIAVLSTVAMLLRMRTASLHEIQLRLAALEELFQRGADDSSM